MRLGLAIARKKLAQKTAPHITLALMLAAWVGFLPGERIHAKEVIRCSCCGKSKKGDFLFIHIPQTGGLIRICSVCEKKQYRRIEKWLKGLKKKLKV